MPLVQNNTVYIARDNGSLSAYDQTNGTLKWLTIISSRSGRNDLESQRDAEMNILVSNNRLYYGHFKGEIAALDFSTGDIVWSSPIIFLLWLSRANEYTRLTSATQYIHSRQCLDALRYIYSYNLL